MQFENDSQQSPWLDSPKRGSMIEHIMNNTEKIAELRHSLARYGLPPERPPISLGHPQADSVLGGGLRPGGLHEVFAEVWSASGFAVLLAMLAARGKPLFWVRPDFEALEYGAVSPQGLGELGGDPRQLILVRTRKVDDALSAASDILACPHAGALLLEVRGQPKALDLVASRRLSLAASESGVTIILLRQSAHAEPSAALTRWQVASAPSRSDLFSSSTSNAASKPKVSPRPSHFAHIPIGLLNENRRGSNSGKPPCPSGHERFAENTR